jgi:hypothetical protein
MIILSAQSWEARLVIHVFCGILQDTFLSAEINTPRIIYVSWMLNLMKEEQNYDCV